MNIRTQKREPNLPRFDDPALLASLRRHGAPEPRQGLAEAATVTSLVTVVVGLPALSLCIMLLGSLGTAGALVGSGTVAVLGAYQVFGKGRN